MKDDHCELRIANCELRDARRIVIFCGHYGSGKTNIAVNYALWRKRTADKVAIIDLDIVNPYFRTKDSDAELRKAGVELICSDYAGSNLDIPALPAEMQRPIADRSWTTVIDVGGDDQGAVALGRFSDQIRDEGNYDMLFVANFYRPLTRTPEEALGVLREIEAACGLRFTGVVNNSNLGRETTPADVLGTAQKAEALCKLANLPLVMTTVEASLLGKMQKNSCQVFPLTLQSKIF